MGFKLRDVLTSVQHQACGFVSLNGGHLSTVSVA